MNIEIYTDGSCHTQLLNGAWAAMVFIDGGRTVISGVEENTTHNRMELTAVIKALQFTDGLKLFCDNIYVYSDSQYVVDLPSRMDKLMMKDFITKSGKVLQNSDLLRLLIAQLKGRQVQLIKVKAHVKNGNPLNREVDLFVRNLLRKNITDGGK